MDVVKETLNGMEGRRHDRRFVANSLLLKVQGTYGEDHNEDDVPTPTSCTTKTFAIEHLRLTI